jgi:DNA replication protein DnaC
MSKLDETLKKIAAGMPTGKSAGPDFLPGMPVNDLPGDPNCPYCHGIGYLRKDVPVGHPDFGRLEICSCRDRQISQQVRQRLFTLSNLEALSHLTFENFNPRGRVGLWPKLAANLEQAYNQAHHYAQDMHGWLLLRGKTGCGKTHLAAAIANFAVSMGVPTLFVTVPELLDMLRAAYSDPESSFEERFDEICRASLLVLDDFGTQNATPWAQEKLFQILNFRYINKLPLVITTNLFIGDIESRIRSRLEDPDLVTIVNIMAPDYRDPTGDLGHHELSSLGLMREMTFASFDLRRTEGLNPEDQKSLERAFRAARQFAERPEGWIVFTGPYGCGKTHLAAAIANYRTDIDSPPMFVVVPDLLDYLRAAFSPGSTVTLDRRFDEVRSAPFLILDDLGTQAITPWVREKLYQLFNHRYLAELPTVITTAEFKEEMDPRLRSRMEDQRICEIYAIKVTSYRGIAHKPIRRLSRRKSTPR